MNTVRIIFLDHGFDVTVSEILGTGPRYRFNTCSSTLLFDNLWVPRMSKVWYRALQYGGEGERLEMTLAPWAVMRCHFGLR